MSKAKTISEKTFEDFKKSITDKLENRLPLELTELYKEYFEVYDTIYPKFCEQVNDLVTPNQLCDYTIKLTNRMRDELEMILDSNKSYYEEWIDMLYEQSTKSLTKGDVFKFILTQFFRFRELMNLNHLS